MAQVNGIVNPDGSSNGNGYTSVWNGADYRITYSTPFSSTPTTLAQDINYDFRAQNAPLEIKITPTSTEATIGFFNQNTMAPVQVSFNFLATND